MLTIPAANHFNGREGQRPRYVIVHGTAGFQTAQQVANYFARPSTQASTHYVVGRDGLVVQCVDEQDAAWANGPISGQPATLPFREASDGIHRDAWWGPINPNLVTIAIEHVKPSTDNSDQLTDAQKAASFRLVADICARWNIPRHFADSNGGITGHFSMDPVNRSRCPGPYPWNDLWNYLKGDDMISAGDPFTMAHFTDLGGNPPRWRCKDPNHQFDIVGGILDYWRRTNGAFRLPRSNEIYNVLPRGASFQVFEAGVLVWDPAHALDDPGFGACYAMHLDGNTAGLEALMKLAGVQASQGSGVSQATIDGVATQLQAISAASQSGLTAITTAAADALKALGKS